MKKLFLTIFLLANFGFADDMQNIVKSMFLDKNFNGEKYFTDELKGVSNLKFFVGNIYKFDGISKLDKNGEFEVYRVAATVKNDDDWYDVYIYTKDDKIYAARSLALMQIPKKILKESKKKPNLSENDKKMLKNLRLLIARDSELIEFGKKNIDKFEEIYKIYKSSNAQKALEMAKNLNLDNVFENENFTLLVGGITDNSVGFMRVENIEKLPKITPSEYIMIEKISEKWYLFKTT